MNTLDISKLDTIQRVHTQLFVHYRHILENTPDWSFRKRELSRDYLIEFCKLAVLRILKNELSRDKMGRWLGYIQGSLIQREILDTNTERNKVRKMFHRAYKNSGIPIPDTIDI